jgi:hypothetical protein
MIMYELIIDLLGQEDLSYTLACGTGLVRLVPAEQLLGCLSREHQGAGSVKKMAPDDPDGIVNGYGV